MNKKIIIICLLVLILGIAIYFNITKNEEQNIDDVENKRITSSLFNKKIIYDFGAGSAFEIDIPKVINNYNEIVIRNNYLLIFSDDDDISIGKNETIFENLPPNDEMLVAGASKSYKLLYENDDTKLYEVTYNFSYMSPDGAETESNMSYSLYKKSDDCTLEIIGNNEEKVLEIESYITATNELKTLEEQFYGITVFDNRIIDTSKVTINEIYNGGGCLDIGINDIDVRFLSKSDKSFFPELKQIKNWDFIKEINGYQIYHGSSGSVQSDALKIIKDNKEYYINLSIPASLYKNERKTNSNGSISIYMYLTQENIEKIIEEIFSIIL